MAILQDLYELAFLVVRQTEDDEKNSSQLIRAFIGLHLFGFFGIIIMVLTVCLSRAAPRHPTWFSFTFSWIISTLSYTLLFFANRLSGPEPEYSLCLVQSVMIYSAPPLTAATTCALVIQIWFFVRSVVTSPGHQKKRTLTPMWLASLLVAPYLLYVALLVGTLIVGIRTPSTVRRIGTGIYCSFANRIPGRISTSLIALIMTPTVFLEIQICFALRKNWGLVKSLEGSLNMILRVAVFTFTGVFAIAISILFIFSVHHGPQLNIIIALIPVTAVLVFATQGDLIRVWMFWKKRPVANTETGSLTLTATISSTELQKGSVSAIS